jgi:endogenous inhibitor of DNA gyrase (YacG/DUF329 family)
MLQNKTKSINCPNCQTQIEWNDSNKHRPFCSKRCQLIDFGEWATEKKNIIGEPVYIGEDEDGELLQ